MPVFRIVAAIAIVIAATVLPFLPGRYDHAAVTLSTVAILFGRLGLLLVPAGLVWMIFEHSPRLAAHRYRVAVAGAIACSLIWAALSLAAMLDSVTLGLASLTFGAYAVRKLQPRLKRPGRARPLYLIVVPVAVSIIQLTLARSVPELSRSRAIRNSAALIADIERHRQRHGRYPTSILSVNQDYLPSVIGIEEYRYEPSGDAYNLMFEQPSFELGVREIVMYNPLDQQVMTSHAMDVLQMTPEQLALDRTRGHNAVHEARQRHWKYFWFD